VPIIDITYDEDDNVTTGTMNFLDIKKSVTVSGNALMIAIDSINSWAERLNLYVDPETDETLDQRFP